MNQFFEKIEQGDVYEAESFMRRHDVSSAWGYIAERCLSNYLVTKYGALQRIDNELKAARIEIFDYTTSLPNFDPISRGYLGRSVFNTLAEMGELEYIKKAVVVRPEGTRKHFTEALYYASLSFYKPPQAETTLYLAQFIGFSTFYPAHRSGESLDEKTEVANAALYFSARESLPYQKYLEVRFTAKFKEFFYVATRVASLSPMKDLTRWGSYRGRGRELTYDYIYYTTKKKMGTWWKKTHELDTEDAKQRSPSQFHGSPSFEQRYDKAASEFGLQVYDRARNHPFPSTGANMNLFRAQVYSIGTEDEPSLEIEGDSCKRRTEKARISSETYMIHLNHCYG